MNRRQLLTFGRGTALAGVLGMGSFAERVASQPRRTAPVVMSAPAIAAACGEQPGRRRVAAIPSAAVTAAAASPAQQAGHVLARLHPSERACCRGAAVRRSAAVPADRRKGRSPAAPETGFRQDQKVRRTERAALGSPLQL